MPAANPQLSEQRRKQEQDTEKFRRIGLWNTVATKIGPRYVACRLGGFKYHGTEKERSLQGDVLKKVSEYASHLSDKDPACNVVFFGPCGTGKDFLMTALIFEATVSAGKSAMWINGLDLFGDVRDGFNNESSEGELLDKLTSPDILALSDPLPPFGGLTNFQAGFLFRLIDRRYRQMKPTWITANFKDGDDANSRCSPQIIDRLKDGALVCNCFWRSYRTYGNQPVAEN